MPTVIANLLILAINSSLTTHQAAIGALEGEWIFVEDLTEGRTLEQLSPPMGSRFVFRIDSGKVILVSGHGGGRKEVAITPDGSIVEVPGSKTGEVARYRGWWKENTFTYEIDFIRSAGEKPEGLIRREFKPTSEGLIVRSNLGSKEEFTSTGVYRHPQDIPMPTAAKALISSVAWLYGNWSGNRGSSGTTTIEERWSPAAGGSMLGVSRTISRDRLSAFEYLRILERDGGLVYIAQPGGAPPTEFVLTQVTERRMVFENPRHDYPKKIVYELQGDGSLVATIGYTRGGTPRRFEYKRANP